MVLFPYLRAFSGSQLTIPVVFKLLCRLEEPEGFVKNISVLVLPLEIQMPSLRADIYVLTSFPNNSVAYQNLRVTGYMIESQLLSIMENPLHDFVFLL